MLALGHFLVCSRGQYADRIVPVLLQTAYALQYFTFPPSANLVGGTCFFFVSCLLSTLRVLYLTRLDEFAHSLIQTLLKAASLGLHNINEQIMEPLTHYFQGGNCVLDSGSICYCNAPC